MEVIEQHFSYNIGRTSLLSFIKLGPVVKNEMIFVAIVDTSA